MNQDQTSATNELSLAKEELDLLTSLILKININMDLTSFINELIFTLRSTVPFDGCNIAVIDKKGYLNINEIPIDSISKKSNLSKDYLETIYAKKLHYETSSDWASIAAREKKEIYYPEINLNEFSPEDQQVLTNYGITGLYYLPIIINDKPYGVLRFHNYELPMILSEYEKNLIRRRVLIIAKAFENFSMYNDIKEKSKIIERDLMLAQMLQTEMLPKTTPNISGMEIAIYYKPMTEVGGDFYDFIYNEKKNQNFGLLLTDVSGHGVPAAFITSMIKAIFHSELTLKIKNQPAKLITYMNKQLMNKTGDHFVTGCYCYFNQRKKKLHIANAGHTEVYKINRRFGELKKYRPGGTVMGYISDAVYEEDIIPFKSGDRFILYTDGLTEAKDENNIMFEKQIEHFFYKHYQLETHIFLNTLLEKLKKHTGINKNDSFDDDVAIIVIDIL